MTPESKKQLAALVMQYGAETVAKAAESVTSGNKAPLILLNKSQSLPIEDRAPFYRFAAEMCARSDEDAWEVCRAWDKSASCRGGAGLESLQRRVE